MNQIRLLPIVVLAASALLVLKAIGIASGGGYTLGGVSAVQAQDNGQAEGFSADDLLAAEAAADALFEATPGVAESLGDLDIWALDEMGLRAVEGAASTQDVLLERLAERRAELDDFASELATRLALVEAAEIRIEQRLEELGAIEAQINAMLDARETAEAEQFAALVTMYENMRPADAATIFNDLETGVLVRVGQAMNPRKLGPIMAKMQPTRAQDLTVLLAQADPIQPAPAAQDFSSLPQIVGQ